MLLKNAQIVDDTFTLRQADIRLEGEKILEIGSLTPFEEEEVLELSGCYILPGFIDTHIHGAFGQGINCSDIAGLAEMATFEASQGVTAFAITTAAPKNFDTLLAQLETAAQAIRESEKCQSNAAKIAAIHAEGPFLSRRRPGAMDPERFCDPKPANLDRMIACSGGYLRLLTVAPETDGACALIRYAVSQGLVASLGHSVATYDEALAGIEAGATQATHTFNGMPAYHHREPGVLGAALLTEGVKCEMICDYVHLHPATVRMIYRLKGADNINMISDSVNVAGTTQAELDFDGVKASVVDGVIRRADGTIAGSAMTLMHGVQNLLKDGYPMTDVAKMAARNPAETLGISHVCGSLAPGKLADLAVLDKNYRVIHTFVNGRCVYSAE